MSLFAPLSQAFRALGDPLRLRLIHLIALHELSVSELVRILDTPQPTISRHLKILREEGLVVDRPDGPATYYRATIETSADGDISSLHVALADLMRTTPLDAQDARELEKVLALRNSDSGEFFDRVALRWDTLREECFGPTFHLEALVRLLPQEWTVADLGTGTGYLLPLLGEHFSRVIGIDHSQSMLDLARQRIVETEGVEVREGSLESLPLGDGEVDLALAYLVLHNVQPLRPALTEIYRCLKPGGRLLIVEADPSTSTERLKKALAGKPRMGLEPQLLSAELSECGFQHIKTSTLAATDGVSLYQIIAQARPTSAAAATSVEPNKGDKQ